MGAINKIEKLEDFKQMVLEDLNYALNNGNVAELTKDLIKTFARDTEKDIIYCSENTDTMLRNYPLFYFVDCKNNIFIAYNKNNVDEKTLNNYKYREEEGCLYFMCNTDTSYNVNVKNVGEMDIHRMLNNITWYKSPAVVF